MKINCIGGGKIALALIFFLVMGLQPVLAQNNAVFDQATIGIARYVPVIQRLCYTIAAIVAVASVIIVYFKMNTGDEKIKRSIVLAFGSCVFLISSAQALPMFFGLDVNSNSGMSMIVRNSYHIYESGDYAKDESGKYFFVDENLNRIYEGTYGWTKLPDGSTRNYIIADDGKRFLDAGAPVHSCNATLFEGNGAGGYQQLAFY